MRQLPVPAGLAAWFDSTIAGAEGNEVSVTMKWRCGLRLVIGSLSSKGLFRYTPCPSDFLPEDSPERTNRLLAKAVTRAGWLRPLVDPRMVADLVQLRKMCTDPERRTRVEFIFDTNAMVEGVGHWLVDLFADSCDLVVTAVTLREMQDQHETAQFAKPLKSDTDRGAKRLGARQLYLAANRFRERTEYNRVLWRELELDDTALLLSRGAGGGKRSESDTMLLRTVRHSIHDRVGGLERFFVTGDTALARRASTELPSGRVVAAQVKELVPGQTYVPCAWWPGRDQGCRVHRHPSRLLWELLAIADELELASNEKVWDLRGFSSPMWPSDYSAPWALVSSSACDSGQEEGADTAEPRIWPSISAGRPSVEENLQSLSASTILDLLFAIASATEEVVIPERARTTSERQRHTAILLEGLELARVGEDGRSGLLLQGQPALAEAWRRGDHEGIFEVVRGWVPVDEWAVMAVPPKRPAKTQQSARTLAGWLGQGAHIGDTWKPGGGRPSVTEIRKALLEAVPKAPPYAISIYGVFVDVLLSRLNVHPMRAMAAWDRMKEGGALEGFEPRKGGSSSGRQELEIAQFSPSGWATKRLDLEAYRGYRDLNFRREG